MSPTVFELCTFYAEMGVALSPRARSFTQHSSPLFACRKILLKIFFWKIRDKDAQVGTISDETLKQELSHVDISLKLGQSFGWNMVKDIVKTWEKLSASHEAHCSYTLVT